MKILTVDVGVGTQDIMFYDSTQPIENSPKLVMPSPTKIIANKIRKSNEDLFINGETMGGGPVNRAIKDHIEKGYNVYMTEYAARTVRDNLEYVKSTGINIVSENEARRFIEWFNVAINEVVIDDYKHELRKK